MKIFFLTIFIFYFFINQSICQNIEISDDEFQKLEIYAHKFQYPGSFIFQNLLRSCRFCYPKPYFEKINFDSSTSILSLKGKIFCNNSSTYQMNPSNFQFVLGDFIVDTSKHGLNFKDPVIYPYEIIHFYKTNIFELNIKIHNKNDVLCLTLCEKQVTDIDNGELEYIIPIDYARFYKVGELIK